MNKKEEVMKKKLLSFAILSISFCLLMTGCQKTSNQTWENMKTAGSYLNRGIDSLWGRETDSRLITNENEFIGPDEEDFIPLDEQDLKTQFTVTDKAIPQPKYSPGDKGCPIGGIGDFQEPKGELASLFKRLHFETDDHVIRDRDELLALQQIANYMKKNPRVYLSIGGHCDERASAAYNMALGARRANHIRVLLIKQGIDFNRIYTISYGKEKPLSLGHTPDDWKANRRAEFKIFVR